MSAIFTLTGNPFVDAGIYVMSELLGKEIDKIEREDLKKLIPQLVDVYFTDGWRNMIYLIFTTNHPAVHPSKKKDKGYYEKLLNALVDDVRELSSFGACVSCGRRDKSSIERKFGIGRELVPLTGSAELVNFFPRAMLGLEMCSACLLAIQFMPIFLHYCGGKFLLMHSASDKVMRYWAKNCVNHLRKQIVTGNFTGCFVSDEKNPVNSLFRSIENLIREYDERWFDEDIAIRFYHFANPGQSPSVEIFDVPSPVFRFLAYVKQIDSYDAWVKILRRGETTRGVNRVYMGLLNGESIVRYFFGDEREIYGNWNLLKFYLKEVREMDEKRINAIRAFADRISDLIRQLDDDKRLRQIENAKDYAEFRNVLRFIEKDAIRVGFGEPIVKFDEYVNLILPDGAIGWNEVRDLLLFRIYEVLHGWLVERKFEVGEQSE